MEILFSKQAVSAASQSGIMNENKKKVKGLGLCSGGLDSILAGVVLWEQGIDVVWVTFETPFFSADKAKNASRMTGIPLIIREITDRYLPMLKNPPVGYGQRMNPCMDCHALMFRIAGEMMGETGADFLFSGEVMGQRPMSQTRTSLRYVEKNSGYDGSILRPLSAKNLPPTRMEEEGLVDRERLYDLSGRSRKPQIALAKAMGITDYPAPAGGCRLTDVGYSRRLRDFFDHSDTVERSDLELLKYGRHIRLSPSVKVIIGRGEAENEWILGLCRPDRDVRIRMHAMPGPEALIPGGVDVDTEAVETAAAICAGYSRAPADIPVEVLIVKPAETKMIFVVPIKPIANSDLIIP